MKLHRINPTSLAVVLLLTILLTAGSAQSLDFPKTAAGARIEAYLKAFNSGSESEMTKFFEQNLTSEALQKRSMAERINSYRQMKAELGSLDPQKISLEDTTQIKLIAHTSSDKWVEFSFLIEDKDPFLLQRLRVDLLDGPPDLNAPTSALTEPAMLQEVQNFLTQVVEKDEFSGVVLIAKKLDPLYFKAFGLASKEFQAPNRLETRFNLGSINKFITRIAIEQLIGKGLISPNDTVGRFLPDYPNPDVAQKVTVSQLLDMTSGIGDFFNEKYINTPKNQIRTLEDYLALFSTDTLAFKPGTNMIYSNGGYIVLGLIIQKVSGQSYYDYVDEHIYKVAGMAHTGHLDADVPTANVASGYTLHWDDQEHPNGTRRNNFHTRPARGSSAGGGYSTAEDLLKLLNALQENKLSAPKISERVNQSGYGYAGGAPGINASIETLPEKGYSVIVLSNYDPPTAVNVSRKIRNLLKSVK